MNLSHTIIGQVIVHGDFVNAKAVSAPFSASHRTPRRSRAVQARLEFPRGFGVRWVSGEGIHRFGLRTSSLRPNGRSFQMNPDERKFSKRRTG